MFFHLIYEMEQLFTYMFASLHEKRFREFFNYNPSKMRFTPKGENSLLACNVDMVYVLLCIIIIL